MKIKWLGHSCILITSQEGIRIVTDPYPWGWLWRGPWFKLRYPPINEEADIVTISHNDADHNNIEAIRGAPEIVKKAEKRIVKGITIKGIKTRHGNRFLSRNIVFCLEVNRVRICHLGDIGQLLSDFQLSAIGHVDILLAPFSGFPAMRPEAVAQVCKQINPKVVIPIHYRTPACDMFFMAKPDRVYRILKEIDNNLQWLTANETEFTLEQLLSQEETAVWVFPPYFRKAV